MAEMYSLGVYVTLPSFVPSAVGYLLCFIAVWIMPIIFPLCFHGSRILSNCCYTNLSDYLDFVEPTQCTDLFFFIPLKKNFLLSFLYLFMSLQVLFSFQEPCYLHAVFFPVSFWVFLLAPSLSVWVLFSRTLSSFKIELLYLKGTLKKWFPLLP